MLHQVRIGRPTITVDTTLGEWIGSLYDAFLEAYGDPELAELAAVTVAQERLLDGSARWTEPTAEIAA